MGFGEWLREKHPTCLPNSPVFEGEAPLRPPEPEKSNPENLTKLKLVASQKPEGRQLNHMRDGCVVLDKRDRSDVWQVNDFIQEFED